MNLDVNPTGGGGPAVKRKTGSGPMLHLRVTAQQYVATVTGTTRVVTVAMVTTRGSSKGPARRDHCRSAGAADFGRLPR